MKEKRKVVRHKAELEKFKLQGNNALDGYRPGKVPEPGIVLGEGGG